MREERTEVLIVGAGPVGLWTALLLAQAGVETRLIDREPRTAARSYACALHPRTLQRFEPLGLTERLLAEGHRVERMAFYQGKQRCAELQLGRSGEPYPFLLILPQSALEKRLEERLAELGVRVGWNHRFCEVEEETELLAATVEELGGTATGYIVPHWEAVVKERFPIRTQFLLGADGQHSLVRQRLGIEPHRVTGPDLFAAYEFEADRPSEPELRVVLEPTTTNVLWPLGENKHRWTFQVTRADLPREFPEKERRAVRLAEATVDERLRQFVQQAIHQRAPWFEPEVKTITWCTQVAFEQRLAQPFGRGRIWLVGDAAHQTGPVGVQSMNQGFAEAEALVALLRGILRGEKGLEDLESYNLAQQDEWRRLLGLSGGLQPTKSTPAWAREQLGRLIPCLPACGEALGPLAGQLGLEPA